MRGAIRDGGASFGAVRAGGGGTALAGEDDVVVATTLRVGMGGIGRDVVGGGVGALGMPCWLFLLAIDDSLETADDESVGLMTSGASSSALADR